MALLVELPCLFDLAFEDGYYGAAPIVDEPSYRASALRSLKQLGVLDGRTIIERQRSDAEEEFLQRSLRFNTEVERLKLEAQASLASLDRERQASAAGLRGMRSQHSRSVSQLHALITAGQKSMKQQEEGFLRAHKQSRLALKKTLHELRAEYVGERVARAADRTSRVPRIALASPRVQPTAPLHTRRGHSSGGAGSRLPPTAEPLLARAHLPQLRSRWQSRAHLPQRRSRLQSLCNPAWGHA